MVPGSVLEEAASSRTYSRGAGSVRGDGAVPQSAGAGKLQNLRAGASGYTSGYLRAGARYAARYLVLSYRYLVLWVPRGGAVCRTIPRSWYCRESPTTAPPPNNKGRTRWRAGRAGREETRPRRRLSRPPQGTRGCEGLRGAAIISSVSTDAACGRSGTPSGAVAALRAPASGHLHTPQPRLTAPPTRLPVSPRSHGRGPVQGRTHVAPSLLSSLGSLAASPTSVVAPL